MASPVFVTAQRNRDLSSSYHGTLGAFRFHKHRVDVDWFCGEVRVMFPSWSKAQKAVNQLRVGDGRLWDAAVSGRF
jgi:hypothetical protein